MSVIEVMRYPNRLRELRAERQWTLENVAEYMNITVASASRHESGDRSLDATLIDKYATLYGVSPFEVFVGSGDRIIRARPATTTE